MAVLTTDAFYQERPKEQPKTYSVRTVPLLTPGENTGKHLVFLFVTCIYSHLTSCPLDTLSQSSF